MSGLLWLDSVSRLVRPEVWTSLWVAGVALLLLAFGLRRGWRWWSSAPAMCGFVALAGLAVAAAHLRPSSAYAPVALGTLAGAALVWWILVGGAGDSTPVEMRPPSAGWAWRVLGPLLLVLTAVMSVRLTTYLGSLQTWEPPVVTGFGEALRAHETLARFAGERMLWQEGLVSSSQDSFLYGVPVYTLWLLLGPSLWAMRAVALAWAVLAVLALFVLGRELAGPAEGLVAVSALAANALLLYYGRYGVSLSATLAATVVAAWLVARLRARDPRPPWQLGLAGVACFAATLAYSPARPVVAVLLALVGIWAFERWRPFSRRHLAGVGWLVAVVGVGVAAQAVGGHLRTFHHARGEQLLNILAHPDYASEFLGYRPPGERPTVAEGAAIVAQVLRRTVPELVDVLTPGPRTPGLAEETVPSDPPALPLLPAALFPFAILGLVQAVRAWREPRHALTLAWFGGIAATVLLTTRVDVHRMWLTVVPLALWAAAGLLAVWRSMRDAGWGVPVRVVSATGLYALLGWTAITYSFPLRLERPGVASAMIHELERITGPVVFGGTFDHREQGAIELYLLARVTREAGTPSPLLSQGLLEGLSAESPTPEALAELRRLLRAATVVLGPASTFARAAERMAALGYRVAPVREGEVRAWRFERLTQPLRFASVDVTPGPEVPLTSLPPLATDFGFEPPRIDQAWAGGPIHLRGVAHEKGVGMHAPCSMTFPVPESATFFRVRVGLDDSAASCDRGLVVVSLLGDENALLFESDLIDRTTVPLVVTVPVAGRRRLTLEASEGGNGRDCDHVSWGDPVFILKAP